MSEFDRKLREMQAEMHSIDDENALIRRELDHMARREDLLDMLKILSDRIDASEVAIVTWFDLMEWRLDRSGCSIEERADKIERPLERLARCPAMRGLGRRRRRQCSASGWCSNAPGADGLNHLPRVR